MAVLILNDSTKWNSYIFLTPKTWISHCPCLLGDRLGVVGGLASSTRVRLPLEEHNIVHYTKLSHGLCLNKSVYTLNLRVTPPTSHEMIVIMNNTIFRYRIHITG